MTYTARLKILGKTYDSKGETIVEAITNFSIPGVPRGVGVLIVSNGDKTKEKILPAKLTWRLFNPSPTMKNLAIKQISSLFNL